MAHQATNIPWTVLASNLKWTVDKQFHPDNGDLHLRFQSDQAKKLNYFVEAFVRNIRDHSSTSRKKYPKRYDPPAPEEVILDDAVVRKISPTVHRWRSRSRWNDSYAPSGYPQSQHPAGFCGGICQHKMSAEECHCPIPWEERRASAFYRKYITNPCYKFFEVNGKAFFNQEIVKTLLLYGEMDTIFRVCAHPNVDLQSWWSVFRCYCENRDAGWDMICKMAMLPYMCLNVIYCFPETWDPASGRTDERDYRQMRMYQYMLKTCTMSGVTADVATHPHRQFFGIADYQFHRTLEFCGKLSFKDFLNSDNMTETKAVRSDIPRVQQILHSKGLPMELVLDIMEMAEYAPVGRLQVPHDPFHRDNRGELAKYLKYCWELLVRCDMMAGALGMEIPWKDLMIETMRGLFGCGPRRWIGRSPDGKSEVFI